MSDFDVEFHVGAALVKDFKYFSGNPELWKKPC